MEDYNNRVVGNKKILKKRIEATEEGSVANVTIKK